METIRRINEWFQTHMLRNKCFDSNVFPLFLSEVSFPGQHGK